MNRQVPTPQALRVLQNGFNNQQQPPQQARSVSSRMPNGKIGNNASGWALGSGVPFGSAGGAGAGGLQNPSRQQQMGGNISFAQSLGGSQQNTPLDPSEFPSLSNSSQLANSAQSSMWSTVGTRNAAGQAIQRSGNTPLSSQQGQQDDMFNPAAAAARLQSAQAASFRFGNQGNIGQPAPQTQPGAADDFPPLNRTANAGDIGQDRAAGLMSNLGYGAQVPKASPAAAPAGRGGGSSNGGSGGGGGGNGLLNALSVNNRVAGDVRTPVGMRPPETRSMGADDDLRQRQGGDAVQSPIGEAGAASQAGAEARKSVSAIGGDAAAAAAVAASQREEGDAAPNNTTRDPLAGMSDMDRWGMKGLRTLMSIPEYRNSVTGRGIDLTTLGIDLSSNEMISDQIFWLYDDVPPHPAIPKFRLPDCYKVSNVGPIENKISSFNEETLFWIFYSCPGDIKQQLAAIELNNRNWRWHKRNQVWLTKDDNMMPQVMSPTHERGFYIIWDTGLWRKERTQREITLNYADLENSPVMAGVV